VPLFRETYRASMRTILNCLIDLDLDRDVA
jgi:hypothetical protein